MSIAVHNRHRRFLEKKRQEDLKRKEQPVYNDCWWAKQRCSYKSEKKIK